MAASRARGRRKPPARRASAVTATLARGDRDGGADASACTVALGADDDDEDEDRRALGDEAGGNAWTTRKVGARAMVGMDASRGRRTAEGVGESVAGRRERRRFCVAPLTGRHSKGAREHRRVPTTPLR